MALTCKSLESALEGMAIPRIKCWFWKLWRGVVQTKFFLISKNFNVELTCSRYGVGMEDITYLLLE